MTKRVVLFFPHNPYPPITGAHRRCLQMLAGLVECGYGVLFVRSSYHSHVPWCTAAIEGLRRLGASDVKIYAPTGTEHFLNRVDRRLARSYRQSPGGIRTQIYCTNLFRAWFRRIVERFEPDILFINYVWFDQLVDHSRWRSVDRVIETHDLISVNNRMQDEVRRLLNDFRAGMPAELLFDEAFIEKVSGDVDPQEVLTYDRYDKTIAISESEQKLLQGRLKHSRSFFIPGVIEPPTRNNSYNGLALFPTGPNSFNVQGLLYFVKRVLPLVLQRRPAFSLDVTGTADIDWIRLPEIRVLGFVPDLAPIYGNASMVVAPNLGGTGQQIKILEAMAHGVPVVTANAKISGSIVHHGETGFIARNAQEFAEYVLLLDEDRALCRRMGDLAREMVSAEYLRYKNWPDLLFKAEQ